MTPFFDYVEAFSRNIGWVTETEQALLRGKRVAIAGMGGGGAHLLTLAQLGIGAVHIADLDTFELANCNRQAGAMLSSLEQPKVDVLALPEPITALRFQNLEQLPDAPAQRRMVYDLLCQDRQGRTILVELQQGGLVQSSCILTCCFL